MNGLDQNANAAGATPTTPPAGGDWFDQVKSQAAAGKQQPAAAPSTGGGSWFDQVKQQQQSAGTAPPGTIPTADGGYLEPVKSQAKENQTLVDALTFNPVDPKTGRGQGTYRFVDTSKAPLNGTVEDMKNFMKTAPVIRVPYERALELLGHPEHYRGLDSGEPANDWERFGRHVSTQVDMALNPMQPTGTEERKYVLHPDEAEHLFRDYQHDPRLDAMRRGDFAASLPPIQTAIGYARGAAQTAIGAHDIVAGRPTPSLSDLASGQKPQGSALRRFAETPSQNAFQGLGLGAEGMTEFMGGEELLSAVGKVLGHVPSFVEMAKIEKEIQAGTPAGRLFMEALRDVRTPETSGGQLFKGTLTATGVGAGQTYVKTGGDVGATLQSAAEMGTLGTLGAATTGLVEGVKGATIARAAEEARNTLDAQTRFADKMEEYRYNKAKFDYDNEMRDWKKQNAAIDKQHQQNVAAQEAQHAQELARIQAAHPEQVELARTQYKQQVAALEALHQRNIDAAWGVHNQRLAAWTQQYDKEVAAAYAQHQAAEAPKVAASQEARTAAQQDFEQRQAAAQQKAETAAQAAREAETKATAETYGATARASIEPRMRAVEEAGARPITMAQPGGAPGVVVGRKPMVGFNADESLRRVGDYTGARTELQTSLNQTNEVMNEATNGRFTQVRDQVSAAQDKMYANESPENVAAYQSKLKEMDDLIASTGGRVTPELRDAVRQGWRQYYVLGDIGKGLDRSVMGVPGDSATSQIYRGTDGKTLTAELKNAVIKHGRPAVEAALGGPDRLKTLENLGQQTMTNGGRQKLNQAIVEVSKYLEPVEPANLPPEYKEAPFKKPPPTTPEPKFKEPKPPEGMRTKFKEPGISDVWGKWETDPQGKQVWKPFSEEFQEPEHPGYSPEPQAPEKPAPKEPTMPTPEEPNKITAGKIVRLAVKKSVGAVAFGLGYTKGGYVGGSLAKAAAETGMHASAAVVDKVQRTMLSDPKVAKSLLFIARNPGDPKVYGPAIAAMIANQNAQQEQPPQEEQK